jgi:hypothetical protein
MGILFLICTLKPNKCITGNSIILFRSMSFDGNGGNILIKPLFKSPFGFAIIRKCQRPWTNSSLIQQVHQAKFLICISIEQNHYLLYTVGPQNLW